MKDRWLEVWAAALRGIQETAPRCPRSKVAAMLIDPVRNDVVSVAWNGTERGGPDLCGGDICLRTSTHVPSGKQCEVGCSHAEENAIANAAYSGRPTSGTVCLVTREPCGMCWRYLKAAGVQALYVITEDKVHYVDAFSQPGLVGKPQEI